MDSPPAQPPRRGIEAFAYRDFRLYQMARAGAILGAEAQAVAVAWQVYSITHRALDLGYTWPRTLSSRTVLPASRRPTWPKPLRSPSRHSDLLLRPGAVHNHPGVVRARKE